MTKNCHETAATTAYFWKAGASAPCYDLQGRRVSADYHGVVIQRGIKFMK